MEKSRVPIVELRLPSLFGNHMVVQQKRGIPVWGWLPPYQEVEVKFRGEVKTARSNAQGEWKVVFSPGDAGGPFEMTFGWKGGQRVLTNVMVGEVWLCSGQSNMEFPVGGELHFVEVLGKADDPDLRFFTVGKCLSERRAMDVRGLWGECTPGRTRRFSAVAYFFGQQLRQKLKVPVGLIHASWGGTPIEAWMPPMSLASSPEFQNIYKHWDQPFPAYSKSLEVYQRYFDAWNNEVRLLGNLNQPMTASPGLPDVFRGKEGRPSGLFQGMIRPLIPYSIQGVIWYQGESNVSNAASYANYSKLWLEGWRNEWNQGDFPVLITQISSFGPKPRDLNIASSWAELREAQSQMLSLPKTALVVTTDVGDEKDLHPRNKQEVGRRLALAAMGLVYGSQEEISGPVFKEMNPEGSRLRLNFTHAEGGLVAKGGKLCGFSVAGEDRRFVEAQAEVEGTSVVVHAPTISKPAHVRYGWFDNAMDCNLYNKAGLPASSFRSSK